MTILVNRDRQRGMLIGLAVGDALGDPIEFRDPGSFAPVSGYGAGGPHGLAAGEWTDDASMALALAHSIASGLVSGRSGAALPRLGSEGSLLGQWHLLRRWERHPGRTAPIRARQDMIEGTLELLLPKVGGPL